MIEGDFEGAQAVIDAYLAEYAEAERHFRQVLENLEAQSEP
jgi:hypothetical protein